MFGFIFRKLRFLSHQNNVAVQQEEDVKTAGPPVGNISLSLEKNIEKLKELFSFSADLKIHKFSFGPENEYTAALFFIDGLVNNAIVTDAILRPVTRWQPKEIISADSQDFAAELAAKALCSGDTQTETFLSKLTDACLSGDTAIVIENCRTAIVVSSKGWEKRGISEPQSETVVRGPREGFTENLRTNTAMIRRKIKDGGLCVENMVLGRKTNTNICLMYLKEVASPKVVEELRYRLSNLEVDSILESGYIEEYIDDAPFSPFATIGYTEKPDVAAARMLEGRVAVVVDGTPFVLTAPMLFVESFQTTEDYYSRPLYASLIRMLRYVAYFITIFGPALYIALTDFHHEMIPTTLLFTIANAKAGTPFPVFVETLIMVFAFEILREAGIRLPRPVGQAISIVGALVMGDAAVSAGLVGAPVVITVAITAVSGFLVPAQNDCASMLRIVMMVLASALGGFGLAMGFLAILLHLGSLESFGIPYFSGFTWDRNLQDSFVRMPMWTMVKRPKYIVDPKKDVVRQHFFIPPMRPYENRNAPEEESNG